MSRGQSWIILCSLAILTIVSMGICLAVTPAAASAPYNLSNTYTGDLATTLHTPEVSQAGPPQAAPAGSEPLTGGCLLCYSRSHTLLSILSGWMGR
jgi:hypothetical protein